MMIWLGVKFVGNVQKKIVETKYKKIKITFLTVRFLESCSGTTTTEFLWFHSSGIGNQQSLVVRSKDFLQFILRSFIDVFLVVSNQTFSNGLSDGVNLGNVTTTGDFNSDVNTLEFIQTDQSQWFVNFESQDFWLNQSDWGTVNFN